jgi:hypothetical protein
MFQRRSITLLSLVNAVLAAVMVTCFVTAVNTTFNLFQTTLLGNPRSMQPAILFAAFFAAMEVQLARRLLERNPMLSPEWWKTVAVELGLGIAGWLVVVWAFSGPGVTFQNIGRLSSMALAVAGETEFPIGLLLIFAAWGLSWLFAVDLTTLEEFLTPASMESMRAAARDQAATGNRLWTDVFSIGGCMVLLSVFSLSAVRILQGLPVEYGSLGFEIHLFFLCGLGLLAVSRLIILRTDWILEHTRIDPKISRRWIGSAAAFILFVIFIAAALPTRYAFRLFESLKVVVEGLTTGVLIVWMGIVLLFLWIMSHVLPALSIPLETAPPDSIAENLPHLTQETSWGNVLRELFFWGIVVLVLVYIFRRMFRLRFSFWRRLRRWTFFQGILEFLLRFRRRWVSWRKSVVQTVRETWRALREDLAGPVHLERGGFLSLRRLDPRQSIRFYFFALLRRGAERGTARRPAQTPREYTTALSGEVSHLADELQEMARAFEEARYTSHDLRPENARRVRRVWDTIREAFHSTRQRGGPSRKTASKQADGKSSS